jgi:hypothetical protein
MLFQPWFATDAGYPETESERMLVPDYGDSAVDQAPLCVVRPARFGAALAEARHSLRGAFEPCEERPVAVPRPLLSAAQALKRSDVRLEIKSIIGRGAHPSRRRKRIAPALRPPENER